MSETNKEKISVIVPIYKVEKYLDRCINSIVNQTYSNLEIILIDDGSPDNCPAMCDEWAKKDNRIKVVHKQNGGLSSARNVGLDICSGEYICFVDSDDWVENNYVEILFNTLKENNADMSICSINNIDENGKTHEIISPLSKTFYKEDKFDLFKANNVAVVVAWNKLYKKSVWRNLRYPLGRINEDEFVIYDIIKNCHSGIAISNQKLYNYLYRPNSIMTSQNIDKLFDGTDALYERYKNFEDKTLKQLTATSILGRYISLYRCFHSQPIAKEIITRFKQDYKIYNKDIKTFKSKLKFKIFKVCPKLLLLKK